MIRSVNFGQKNEKNPNQRRDGIEYGGHDRQHIPVIVRESGLDERERRVVGDRTHDHQRQHERHQQAKDLEQRERAKGELHETLRRN